MNTIVIIAEASDWSMHVPHVPHVHILAPSTTSQRALLTPVAVHSVPAPSAYLIRWFYGLEGGLLTGK